MSSLHVYIVTINISSAGHNRHVVVGAGDVNNSILQRLHKLWLALQVLVDVPLILRMAQATVRAAAPSVQSSVCGEERGVVRTSDYLGGSCSDWHHGSYRQRLESIGVVPFRA